MSSGIGQVGRLIPAFQNQVEGNATQQSEKKEAGFSEIILIKQVNSCPCFFAKYAE